MSYPNDSYAPPPTDPQYASTSWGTEPPPNQPPPRRFGWGSCLLGCFGVMFVSILACAGIGWYVARQIPGKVHQAAVQAVQKSDLAEDDKKSIVEQLDRVHADYSSGKIGVRQVGQIFEELVNSPLMPVMLAKAAMQKYVAPSGLSEEEKAEADLTFQRIARGIVEKKIRQHELDPAMDIISDGEGSNRQLKQSLSDEEVRRFLQECKKVADEAEIPNEPFDIHVGDEFKKAVDQALGTPATPPAEAEPQ